MSVKRVSLGQLKKKLWAIVSKYIRLKFSKDGLCECVTCGMVMHWTEAQAGHFIPRAQGNAVYFVEENIHPQCYRCNINLGGNGPEYYPYMVEMYGEEKVTELRQLSKTTLKLTRSDYQEMIDDYSARLKKLESVRWVA